jgi:mRNA interferase MazF
MQLTPQPPTIRRGQVWNVEFDPQVGAEIRKVRPAVIMTVPGISRLPLHIVVPITTGNPGFSRFFWAEA